MNRSFLSAIAFSALMTVSTVLPASAMPTTSQPARAESPIEQAKVILKYKTWRGHRGYRHARPGYRRNSDGFWYPRAAFSVRIAPGVRIKVGPAHARWCRNRYKTYRTSDNTFVAVGGVRRACRSPY
jgi:hypothetical protein